MRLNSVYEYINLMSGFNYFPVINIPAKFNETNVITRFSLIDQIWSNFGFNFDAGVFDDIRISDHFVNFTFLPLAIEKTKVRTIFRNHSDLCIQKLCDSLLNFNLFFPLLSANLDFDAKFNLFFNETLRLYKQCCPINY